MSNSNLYFWTGFHDLKLEYFLLLLLNVELQPLHVEGHVQLHKQQHSLNSFPNLWYICLISMKKRYIRRYTPKKSYYLHFSRFLVSFFYFLPHPIPPPPPQLPSRFKLKIFISIPLKINIEKKCETIVWLKNKGKSKCYCPWIMLLARLGLLSSFFLRSGTFTGTTAARFRPDNRTSQNFIRVKKNRCYTC